MLSPHKKKLEKYLYLYNVCINKYLILSKEYNKEYILNIL